MRYCMVWLKMAMKFHEKAPRENNKQILLETSYEMFQKSNLEQSRYLLQ